MNRADSWGMSSSISPTDTTLPLRERYLGAPTFQAMLGGVEENADLWGAVWRRAAVSDLQVQRAEALAGAWHLLVLSEDWCGDAVNTVPVIARFAELASNVDLRVLARDENPDLMDAHLTGAGSRSIPVVIVLDEHFREVGWWGPRPSALQRWATTDGKSLDKDERYREIRTWYARDKGATTVEEILGVMGAAQSS